MNVTIRKWQVKGLIQTMLSLMYQGARINRLLQRYVTKRLILNERRFNIKLSQCASHMQLCRELTERPNPPFTALELGTGWWPIVPIGLWLYGASRIYSVDINPHMTEKEIKETFRFFGSYIRDGVLKEHLPGSMDKKMHKLGRLAEKVAEEQIDGLSALRELGIYSIVGDVRYVPFPFGKVDLFVSNCVLEHIEYGVMKEIFTRFRKLASKNGICCHIIDLADHYCDFDKKINRYNFLKYSTSAWKKYNSRLHYQNRLRVSDFREIYESCGFEIKGESNRCGTVDDISGFVLAKEFCEYKVDDLLVCKAKIVGAVKS